MEDIIGFEDQIGAKFLNVVKKAVRNPIQAATMKAKTNIATQQAKANLAKRMLQQRNTMVANRIAKGLPIPSNIKNAIVKTATAGKPLPSIIKRGLEIAKQKKAIVPIALPKRANLTRSQIMQKAVAVAKQKGITPQSSLKQMIQKAKVVAQQKAAVPVSTLTRITNPMQVNKATPVQKSFMPVDLPYQNFAPVTKPMRIPATNYTLPTNIDLVEPSVDAGTANYYGK
jgi:hypothetical protein